MPAFNLQELDDVADEYDDALRQIIQLSSVRPLALDEWNYVLDAVKRARAQGFELLEWFFPLTVAGDIPVFSTGLYRMETRFVRDNYPWTLINGRYGGYAVHYIENPQEDDHDWVQTLRGTYCDLPLDGRFLRRKVGWRTTDTAGGGGCSSSSSVKPQDVLVHYMMVDEAL
ncbi:unnamed protein product [Eruca vesicaria subsp. sativa]|uniref:Uncharacterized protein n=1 Tax=Eruca vesicaria subsp. sativa TaxID=29727 RepID=A0ABC8J7U2_ERUVS|nr:unnamed protein product [Eruca vesicaria subsp. sativa]